MEPVQVVMVHTFWFIRVINGYGWILTTVDLLDRCSSKEKRNDHMKKIAQELFSFSVSVGLIIYNYPRVKDVGNFIALPIIMIATVNITMWVILMYARQQKK